MNKTIIEYTHDFGGPDAANFLPLALDSIIKTESEL